MYTRAVTLPRDPAAVWRALTEPDALTDWFGRGVRLDLRPGGQAHFGSTGDHGERSGVVAYVDAGRRLRFRWWPDEDPDDVSEVSYDLEADGDGGTTLTVTERRVAAGDGPKGAGGPAVALVGRRSEVSTSWSAGDQRGFELWAGATRPAVGAGR